MNRTQHFGNLGGGLFPSSREATFSVLNGEQTDTEHTHTHTHGSVNCSTRHCYQNTGARSHRFFISYTKWLQVLKGYWHVRKISKSDYSLRDVSPSVRPSVRMEQLGSLWTDFHEISYLRVFRKSVEKIQVSLKSDKNNEYFTWWPTSLIIPRSMLLRMRKVLDNSRRDDRNTHLVFNNFLFENHAVWYTVEKNIVEPGSLQMTIWCMRISCWIAKVTNTHSEYVIHTALTRTCLNVTLYVHCLSYLYELLYSKD